MPLDLVNIEGNEEADKVAKEDTNRGMYTKTVITPKPWNLIKNKIEEYTNNLWTKRWYKRFKHIKELYGSLDKKAKRLRIGAL